jgi:hypothetical protein
MSLENWGGMTKAQDDSTTIDEAIASAILAHEEDSESHMGAGESIENHRINDVLDHPQGSVVADKSANSQITLSTCFETLDTWEFAGSFISNGFPFVSFGTTTSNNNIAELHLWEVTAFKSEDFDKNLFFQTTFSTDYHGAGDYEIMLGMDDTFNNYIVMGVKIVDNAVTGYFRDGDTLHSVSLGTITRGTTHTIRCFNNKSTGKVEFWINGVKLGTIDFEQYYTSDETMYFTARITKKRTTYGAVLQLYNLIFSRDVA